MDREITSLFTPTLKEYLLCFFRGSGDIIYFSDQLLKRILFKKYTQKMRPKLQEMLTNVAI